MGINPSEITTILKREIAGFDASATVEAVGRVLSVGDGSARVSARRDSPVSSMPEFQDGVVPGVEMGGGLGLIGAVLIAWGGRVDPVQPTTVLRKHRQPVLH